MAFLPSSTFPGLFESFDDLFPLVLNERVSPSLTLFGHSVKDIGVCSRARSAPSAPSVLSLFVYFRHLFPQLHRNQVTNGVGLVALLLLEFNLFCVFFFLSSTHSSLTFADVALSASAVSTLFPLVYE